MLTEKNQYLTAGIHIGMKTCTPYMKQFVYKVREDGLAVFNLKMVDERIGMAANFLSQFGNVLAISRKENAHKAVRAFSEAVNGRVLLEGLLRVRSQTRTIRGFLSQML